MALKPLGYHFSPAITNRQSRYLRHFHQLAIPFRCVTAVELLLPRHQQHRCSALVLSVLNNGPERYRDDEDYQTSLPDFLELRQRPAQGPEQPKPLVRVRLSVNYRVHSRQMLCIGGSQIPFGWSFLSIAKVPMTWNKGDVWTCEVDLPAGQRVEYKYVILEEQDWTKQVDEDAEGLVEISYRSGAEPGSPPDVHVIQKQMAIVAWQPGPNRILQVASEAELRQLDEGLAIERTPARPSPKQLFENRQKHLVAASRQDPFEGTFEALSLDENGKPFLDRTDVWGWYPNSSSRPSSMRGFSF